MHKGEALAFSNTGQMILDSFVLGASGPLTSVSYMRLQITNWLNMMIG